MQSIDIRDTDILFIASKKYSGQNKVNFFIVLHFVKSFVGDRSVFTQYSYYRDLFCPGPELRLSDFHCHVWMHCFYTTKNTVWCMSSILIQMTYFFIYAIRISEHYRVIVIYIPTPSQQVSAILCNINITVWLKSQVHCATYDFVLMHDIFT